MSHKCPDPALLVAYLDRTLFDRDATAIDRHLETCDECPALLASMRDRRAIEQASKTSRTRMTIVAAVMLVSFAGYGLWALRPRSTGTQVRNADPVRSDPAPSSPALNTSAPAASPLRAPATREVSPTRESECSGHAETESGSAVTSRRTPSTAAGRTCGRTRDWRTRDQMVESSNDGGATWTTEHTADRPIRASVFVSADVAWVVGDHGLVLRRTKNGWFGASAPAEANITAVKASSPSRATVTLEDGRGFTTANGGVTWASAP